jgi:hypothetical protein
MRELTLARAERYDMILRTRRPGVVRVTVETLHWITGRVLGSAETLITVTGQALPDSPPQSERPSSPPDSPASGGATPQPPAGPAEPTPR